MCGAGEGQGQGSGWGRTGTWVVNTQAFGLYSPVDASPLRTSE